MYIYISQQTWSLTLSLEIKSGYLPCLSVIMTDATVSKLRKYQNTHTYINSSLVSLAVGRNYRTSLTTILTYSTRLIHIHTSNHTRTPVVSSMYLTFLKNFTNKVNVCPYSRQIPIKTMNKNGKYSMLRLIPPIVLQKFSIKSTEVATSHVVYHGFYLLNIKIF